MGELIMSGELIEKPIWPNITVKEIPSDYYFKRICMEMSIEYEKKIIELCESMGELRGE